MLRTTARTLPNDRYCIAGLVSPFQHPRAEILAMTAQVIAPQKIQEFCNVIAQTPLVNLYRLKSLLCLLVKLAHGVSITPENILFVDNTVLRTVRPDRALFSQREDAEFHIPVDFESAVRGAHAAAVPR